MYCDIRFRKEGVHITKKKEHILACISDAPYSERVIELAKQEADAHHGDFTCVVIEDSTFNRQSSETQHEIKRHVRKAEALGADVETLQGDDVPYLIAEFAKLIGATQIVIDRGSYRRSGILHKSSVPEKLCDLLPDVDIHIIPDHTIRKAQNLSMPFKPDATHFWNDFLKIALILLIATLIGTLFDAWGFDENAIIPLYSLAVLVCCLMVPNYLVCIFSTIASIFIFNYLFALPVGQFTTLKPGNLITYAVMFITSLIIGFLTSAVRRHSEMSTQSAYREKVLFDTNELLQTAADEDAIIDILLNQLSRLTSKDIFFIRYDEQGNQKQVFTKSIYDSKPIQVDEFENEKALANKAWKERIMTGATTSIEPKSKVLYIPCQTPDNVLGVVGIVLKGDILEPLSASICRAIITKAAVITENQILAKEMEEAKTKASNEAMKANLLRAISHDLRTPLTTIAGNLGSLMRNEDNYDAEDRHKIYTDSYDSTIWLINMVENLLSASRMEDGEINIKPTYELMDEIVEAAIQTTQFRTTTHNFKYEPCDNILMVYADAQMIVRVIKNIIDNAYAYTPEGSDILLKVFEENNQAVVQVIDNGNGISDAHKKQIFEMFYIADEVQDARRSMGLGLYLCHKIIEAHHGTITLEDNQPHGCIFTFTLPLADLAGMNLEA